MFKPIDLDKLVVTKECCDWILPVIREHKFSDTSYEQEAVDQVLNRVMRLEKALITIRDDRSPPWDNMDHKEVARKALEAR